MNIVNKRYVVKFSHGGNFLDPDKPIDGQINDYIERS